jgi:lipopolysaccharide transport system permease protein
MRLLLSAIEPILCITRRFDLFWQFTKRTVELQHKGSHLGLVWSVLQPLLLLVVYVFVFGYIYGGSFKEGESKIEFGLNIFVGIICLHFLTEIIASAPTGIISNPSFVKKVVFPLEILPASIVASAVFHFAIGLILVGVGLAVFGTLPGSQALLFPLVLFPCVLLGMGVSWLLSALGVFFRDVGQVVPFLSVVLLFSSAVFYSPSDIPEEVYQYLKYNPVLHFIDMTRKCLLTGDPIDWRWLGYLYAVGISTCQIGYQLFSRMKSAFADVV